MQTGLQTLRPPRHASLAHPALEARRCLRCVGVQLSRPAPRSSHVSRAQDVHDDEPTEAGSTESLFMRELKRRGMSSSTSESTDEGRADSSAGASTSGRVREAPTFTSFREPTGPSKTPQLDRSRQLNSEGLEGLIPRVRELAKLGGSVFLAFAPAVIVISVFFTVLYAVRVCFGEKFVHTGNSRMHVPEYVDPYELLGEPTVDPTIPLR